MMNLVILDLITNIRKEMDTAGNVSNTDIVTNIDGCFESFYNVVLDTIGDDWSNLDVYTAEELGFVRWIDEEELDKDIDDLRNNPNKLTCYEGGNIEEKIESAERTRYLWLIPHYLTEIIPKNIKLTNIFGKEIIYDGIQDKFFDERMGSLSSGVVFTKEEVEKVYPPMNIETTNENSNEITSNFDTIENDGIEFPDEDINN